MMYPFMTLNDGTEIVHSHMLDDGRVKVYFERPDEKAGFHHATCYLPTYEWEDTYGFQEKEIAYFQKLIEDTAHLILEFSQKVAFVVPLEFEDQCQRYCLEKQIPSMACPFH